MTGLPVTILADRKGQLAGGVAEGGRTDALTDADHGNRFVRHLNADGDLVRNRGDSHRNRAQRQRDIIRQRGNAREFHAARDGQLKPGDRRPAHNADNFRVDVKGLQGVHQRAEFS